MRSTPLPDLLRLLRLLPPADVPLARAATVRIIAADLEPPELFDQVADGVDLDELVRIAALTSPEVLHRAGTVSLVPLADRAYGPGAGWAMTAFTHPARPSRFTDGSYGVWYAAWELATSIAETAYHQARRLRESSEPAQPVLLEVLQADLAGMFRDVRAVPEPLYGAVHDPGDYAVAQAVGRHTREAGSDGVVYDSVRHAGGTCAAVFRPRVVRNARRVARITYQWDGARITPGTPTPV